MFSRRGFLALLPAPFLERFIPSPPPVATNLTAFGETTPIVLTGVPESGVGVIARKLYRTEAGGRSSKLIATAGPDDSEWTPVARAYGDGLLSSSAPQGGREISIGSATPAIIFDSRAVR